MKEVVNNGKILTPVVRKASPDDINGIMDVALSVGNSQKSHESGFLMDDYAGETDYYIEKFTKLINELDHFYVVEDGLILGFLIAYCKDEWLHYNPTWIDDIIWSPEFDMKNTDRFMLVDKTAIHKDLTARGLGSLLYDSLIHDIKSEDICDMFAETLISPVPNFASLNFRIKQKYSLAGVRYEKYKGILYTDIVYHKTI